MLRASSSPASGLDRRLLVLELGVANKEFGNRSVVVPAVDPIPDGFTDGGRQRIARGRPGGVPKLAALLSQLAGALDDSLQLRVELQLPCHAGKATGRPAMALCGPIPASQPKTLNTQGGDRRDLNVTLRNDIGGHGLVLGGTPQPL